MVVRPPPEDDSKTEEFEVDGPADDEAVVPISAKEAELRGQNPCAFPRAPSIAAKRSVNHGQYSLRGCGGSTWRGRGTSIEERQVSTGTVVDSSRSMTWSFFF
jgi:hypothetical protein